MAEPPDCSSGRAPPKSRHSRILGLFKSASADFAEPIPTSRVIYCSGEIGANAVIGRQYLARQATTLLKFAKSTTDAKLAALLVEKAADLKSQVDESYPPADQSPRAPDVEPLEQRGR